MADENFVNIWIMNESDSFTPDYEEGGKLLSLIEEDEARLGLHGDMLDVDINVTFSDGSSETYTVEAELGGQVQNDGSVNIFSGQCQSDFELKNGKSREDISDISVVDYVWDFRIYALTEQYQQKATAEERFEYKDFDITSVEIIDEDLEAI